jgi:hypothetical protein
MKLNISSLVKGNASTTAQNHTTTAHPGATKVLFLLLQTITDQSKKKKLEHYLSENYKIIRFFVLGFISPHHQTSIISYGHFDIINWSRSPKY